MKATLNKAGLLLLVIVVWWLSRLPVAGRAGGEAATDAAALAALGFTALAGHLIGRWVGGVGMPQVTGYMLVGLAAGPWVFRVMSPDLVSRLGLVNKIALVLIALAAGGEMRLPELRRQWRAIVSVLVAQTTVVITIGAAVILILGRFFLPVAGFEFNRLLAVGLIMGVIASANSPSVAIAVISELRARGPLTNLVMAVTVPKDVVVIVLFTFFLHFAQRTGSGSEIVSHSEPLSLTLARSLAVGAAFGAALGIYLKHVGRQVELAVLFMAVVLIRVAQGLGLELLFTAVTAGFVVENFSRQGEAFIEGLERVSAPIFVVFFALAGASINLSLLGGILPAALAWATLRIGSIWLGTRLGLAAARDRSPAGRLAWLGYLPQAGVSLGLVALVALEFPHVGPQINTLVLAVIAINQILGPIGFRYALLKAGEVNKMGKQ